jgi:hypothetical protein
MGAYLQQHPDLRQVCREMFLGILIIASFLALMGHYLFPQAL